MRSQFQIEIRSRKLLAMEITFGSIDFGWSWHEFLKNLNFKSFLTARVKAHCNNTKYWWYENFPPFALNEKLNHHLKLETQRDYVVCHNTPSFLLIFHKLPPSSAPPDVDKLCKLAAAQFTSANRSSKQLFVAFLIKFSDCLQHLATWGMSQGAFPKAIPLFHSNKLRLKFIEQSGNSLSGLKHLEDKLSVTKQIIGTTAKLFIARHFYWIA